MLLLKYTTNFMLSITSFLYYLNQINLFEFFHPEMIYFVKLGNFTIMISLSFSLKAVMMQKTMKELSGWGGRLFTWESLL